MENYIIKFKNDLRKQQVEYKKLLKQCEIELTILEKIKEEGEISKLERLIKGLPLSEINKEKAAKQLEITSLLFSLPSTKLIIEEKIEGKNINKEVFLAMYELFSYFTKYIKEQIKETQKIINAFENDKIKEPINYITNLLIQLEFTSLTIEEANKIIGMTIYFNTQYAKKNKNHNIKDIHIIDTLSTYYNEDGTFKYNEDTFMYNYLMNLLFQTNEIINILFNNNPKFTISELTNLLELNNEKLEETASEIKDSSKKEKQKISYSIPIKTRKALEELRKYYKNGSIIAIPDNPEEFYKILDDCCLDEREKKYIINLINDKLSNKKRMIISTYLSENEQIIYQKAINLLNTSSHYNIDTEILKQFIEELQTIIDMLGTNINEEDKKYLLNDIPTIIEQLSLICDKYTVEEDKESSNTFIFLLNKEGIPYIYDDINQIEQTYRKAINSLIQKINKQNQSYFKKILSNEEFLYNMHEVRSQRAHVAFVEVDAGIYVIIGANIPRNGYSELNNRLKNNQLVIKGIERAIKDPNTRNEILSSNEKYLTAFSESQNTSKENKLTLRKNI